MRKHELFYAKNYKLNQYTNKYTEEDYINRCEEMNVVYIGNNRNNKKDTIIEFICNNHVDKGVQNITWGHMRTQKRVCRYCAGRIDHEDAQAKVLNKNIIFISEYKGCEKPVKCFCKGCNTTFVCGRPIDLFKRPCGCPTCAKINRGLKRRKSHEDFVRDMSIANPDITIIGQYTGTHRLIKCRCNIDGHEWESYAANLLNGSAKCPICNMSAGEANLVKFMKEHNINYKTQKTFSDCKDIKHLRFDVYDADNSILFEFQGEQHYFPIDFSGIGEEYATKQFDELQKRDTLKKQYCEKNNITLVCIPYWERDNIERYLLENVEIYKEKYKEKGTA